MKNITKHIPNLFTLANLCCGVLAIILFMEQYIYNSYYYTLFLEELSEQSNGLACFGKDEDVKLLGMLLILFALFFDFMDGFMAKILKAQSPIGAQLDSLADLITFGVAPAILVYISILEYYGNNYLAYLALLIPIFSALRLAKFNVDTEQTDYFKGIPTPANAMFWIGIIATITFDNDLKINQYMFFTLIVVMSLLMMSNMKMLSFKFKNLAFKGDNIYRYLLIVLSILLTITCALLENFFLAIPLVIILYILLSIPYHFSKTKHA